METVGILVESLKNGGAERAAANLSHDLSEKYQVVVIVFDGTNIAYPYNGKLIDLKLRPSNNILQRVSNRISTIKRIKDIREKEKIIALISFMPNANLYNVKSQGIGKTIISIRSTMSQKNLSKYRKYLIRKCGIKSDVTVVLSESSKIDLIQNFNYPKDKAITIYNSCDYHWFHVKDEHVDNLINTFDFSRPTFVTAGRCIDIKGQWHLIRAISLVKEKFFDVQLVIFGEGELKEQLEDYTNKLGVQNNVFFMGYTKNYHAFMEKCNAFVFSSLYEGLGNVILEAIACGMPVISVDCNYGPKEILCKDPKKSIKDITYSDYGILIPAFSMENFLQNTKFENSDYLFANAMISLLEDEKLIENYKVMSLKRAKDFLPEKIKEKWFLVIEGKYNEN